MEFHLYATFRLLAGVKTVSLDLPDGTTVRQAVDALVAERPVLRPHWLDADGDIHAHVHVFVNGNDALNLPQRFDSPLPADSVLDFFPPVGGGAQGDGAPETVIVLAMHGAPPLDYPREELAEFFNLHARMEHAGPAQRAEIAGRYAELDRKVRAWPRTAANDPFFAGASALADALARAAGSQVVLGFNEFCAPALDAALDEAAGLGADRVVVITPMMTRGGEHSEREIPAEVQAAQARHPQVAFRYAWPLDLESIARFLAEQALSA